MEYLAVNDAIDKTGLRLVLTRDVPGPWSESAKAIFRLRQVDYSPVEQHGGRSNPELIAWTGHRNAPVAMYDNEPPRVRWQETLDLAERLGTGPSLYPESLIHRMEMVGLASEICNEGGYAWQARTLMLDMGYKAQGEAILQRPMYKEYQYDPNSVAAAVNRIESFLGYLTEKVKTQNERGSIYLVGDSFSAVDVYWAFFSQMLEALPPEQNPMPDGLRQSWGALARGISGYDPLLIEQRNRIFEQHLWLPLEF